MLWSSAEHCSQQTWPCYCCDQEPTEKGAGDEANPKQHDRVFGAQGKCDTVSDSKAGMEEGRQQAAGAGGDRPKSSSEMNMQGSFVVFPN